MPDVLPDRDGHTPRGGGGSGSLRSIITLEDACPLHCGNAAASLPRSTLLLLSPTLDNTFSQQNCLCWGKFRSLQSQCRNELLAWEAQVRAWLPRRPMSSSSSFFFTVCRNWRGGLTDSEASSTRATGDAISARSLGEGLSKFVLWELGHGNK